MKVWLEKPQVFVREVFGVTPDPWQDDILEAFPHNQRIAMQACKGPGKTALLAWLSWNFLVTRPTPNIAATSVSGDNLRDGLWKEMAKWQNTSPLLQEMFQWTTTRITTKKKETQADWFMSARTWPKSGNSEEQANTLAGLHTDYIMFLLDEAGSIPDAVMASAEAALASCKEGHIVMAGNPTHLGGPLYRAATSEKDLWHRVEITGDPDDPKAWVNAPRVGTEPAAMNRLQLHTYGRDNAWCKAYILGEFPDEALNALIGIEDVLAAQQRHLEPSQYDWAQKRLGVDVARFGDDRTVIFPRQGMAAFKPVQLRGMATTDIAARVAMAQASWGSELNLVDDTGHWGHGVIDNLLAAGIPSMGIQFHGKAINPRYKNRRAEMWLEMTDAIKKGMALPNVPELVAELTTPTYTFVNGTFQLEEKDQIKSRLGRSPDLADALALTFAIPDMPNQVQERIHGQRTSSGAIKVATDYDPYAQAA